MDNTVMNSKRPLLFLLSALCAHGAAPDGPSLYTKNCAGCHEAGGPRIPNREALKAMTAEGVVRALSHGAMRFQGSYLSAAQRVAVAEFVTAKPFAKFDESAGRCTAAPPSSLAGPGWNGWGVDLDNSRMQTSEAAGLTAEQVPHLKLKWAFGFPGDSVAFAQPVIAGGRVFVGSAGGKVYSLDAASGCVYWAFDAGAGVRTAVSIGPGGVAYFGDLQANVYAVDAATGKQIWKTRLDDHPVARITGSPKLFENRLYVPVSSHEEWASADPRYECCKFRGSVAALDSKTGAVIWKTYTIAEEPHPTKKNKIGTQMWGPSGGGVWSSPTIDRKLRRLYFGTGDSYSDPAAASTDSMMALNLDTGEVAWSKQITSGDAFNTNCLMPDRANCPDKQGPDFDFGASPILRTLAGGRRALIVGQKSGVLHSLDPDRQGEVLWQTKLGKGGVLGGLQWGSAADQDVVYAALSDLALQITDFAKLARNEGFQPHPKLGGGMFAVQIATGEKLWNTPPPESACKGPGCSPAQSAAVSLIPGVAFSGSVDGHLRAYSAKDGKIIWDYDTVKDYQTVNKAAAKGGSLDGPGPAIAGGMLFVNSGYGYFNAMAGNELLAFGVE
jgi:polyvinyl alcohol dehydrogenase (cytochrome)